MPGKLQIDKRTKEDIEAKVYELAASYDTGWQADPEDPGIGTALAKIYALQTEENIELKNDVLNRYHTEFINLLDINLQPARPSGSIVVASLIDEALDGTTLPKGTKLLAETEEPVVFETDHSIFVTGSALNSVFQTNAETGAMVPLLGKFPRPEIPGEDGEEPETELSAELGEEEEVPMFQEEEEPEKPEEDNMLKVFTLFGERNGIERNVLIFFHPTVFDVEENDIFIRIKGAPKLVEDIREERMYFAFISSTGICPVDEWKLMSDGETFVVRKTDPCRKVEINDQKYSVFLLIGNEPVKTARKVEAITFASSGAPVSAESVSDGQNDFEVEAFSPFTDTLALYSECFIGHDGYFSKIGAKINVTFDLSFEEHHLTLTAKQMDENLKIIKRKPKVTSQDVPAECLVEEVAIEYFNGTGWKKLPLDGDMRGMFSTNTKAAIDMRFICPDDWAETSAGAYSGRFLRMQVLKADNCYLRPSTHYYPVIKNLRIAYSYVDEFVRPSHLELIYGTKKKDLTPGLNNPKGYVTFRPSEYREDALYMGFQKRLESGPISILFQLQDDRHFEEMKCRFEYLTSEGFKLLKVSDQTQDFAHSGVVRFMPPSDMKYMSMEGRGGFWIRIVRGKRQSGPEEGILPVIMGIRLNAVNVSNIETLPVMDFYVERLETGMRFALGTTNILDAEVWVNEIDRLSREDMKQLLQNEPDTHYAEFDLLGNFTAFFTLWEEVLYFRNATHPRCYVLDRLRNQLIFGDGIRTWIPRITDNTALKVRIRRSAGALGNVDADTINGSMEYLSFIGTLNNPIRAYGGSNLEKVEEALERGSNFLSSRGRLVSIKDYIRAILSFSDTVDQVKGVTEYGDEDGEEGRIYFVLLMKEYADGSFAFHQMVGNLKKYLLQHSEVTVTEEKLRLVEPVFVFISMELWVTVMDMDQSFELTPLLREILDEYLNPLGVRQGKGWRIGTMPKKSQLMMRLNRLKSKALIKKSMIIGRYRDSEGVHEMDLEDIEVTPFMLPVSDRHKVHVLY